MIERGERYDKRNWKWQKATLHINSVIEKSPRFQYIIMRIWGKFKTIKNNRKYVEKSDDLSGEIDFDNVFWINPKKTKVRIALFVHPDQIVVQVLFDTAVGPG